MWCVSQTRKVQQAGSICCEAIANLWVASQVQSNYIVYFN